MKDFSCGGNKFTRRDMHHSKLHTKYDVTITKDTKILSEKYNYNQPTNHHQHHCRESLLEGGAYFEVLHCTVTVVIHQGLEEEYPRPPPLPPRLPPAPAPAPPRPIDALC